MVETTTVGLVKVECQSGIARRSHKRRGRCRRACEAPEMPGELVLGRGLPAENGIIKEAAMRPGVSVRRTGSQGMVDPMLKGPCRKASPAIPEPDCPWRAPKMPCVVAFFALSGTFAV